jgi:hypothetical protein
MRSSIPTILAGIVIWSVILVVAIIVHAVAKVILMCLVAIGFGFMGIRYTKRRAKREEN